MKRAIDFLSGSSANLLPQAIQRKVRFNGTLSAIAILFVLIMITVDICFDEWRCLLLFVFVLMVYVIIPFFNRSGYHLVGRLLLPINSLVLVVGLTLIKASPVAVWFYIIIAIASITLFTYREKIFSISLIAICCLLFIFSFSWLTVNDHLHFASRYDLVIFLVGYAMCMSAGIVIVFIPVRHEYYAEQKLVELTNELRDKQRKYEIVHAASGAILYEYDLINNRVPANLQVNRLLGYEDHELREYTFEESAALIHPDDREKFMGKISKALSNGDAIFLEYRVRTKSGQYIWLSTASVIERDPDNRPKWMIGSLMNIDGRKQAEQKVLEQNEMLLKTNAELDNFVYHVSHDVRAPLSSILGLINLTKTLYSETELRKFIAMMGERARALDRFIHDVLAYSRNSRSTLTLSKVKFRHVLDSVVDELDYMENKRFINIEINIPDTLELIGDAHRIKVIFSNLLSNSIKYYNPNATEPFIRLTHSINCASYQIKIEDNGKGIHQDFLPRIFEMFFRATDEGPGSGIGLYIVKEIVDKLKGTIQVDSQLGEGTSFTITLPLTIDIPPESAKSPSLVSSNYELQ